MQKFVDGIGERSPGGGEDIAVLHPYGPTDFREYELVVEFVLTLEPQRNPFSYTQILHIATASDGKSPLGETTGHPLRLRQFVLDGRVNLLPETGHAAHDGRTHLANGILYILGVYVDGNAHAYRQAVVRPSPLEDVGQRQEAERYVAVGASHQPLQVNAHGLVVIRVSQHHPFGLAGRTRGVDERGQIVGRTGIATAFYLGYHIGTGQTALLHEVIEIDRRMVVGSPLDGRVEKNEFLERRTLTQGHNGIVVLHLPAHKQKAHLGFVDDVLNLVERTGGIERNDYRTVVECRKIHDETFGFVLCICRNVFLLANT